MKNFSNFENIAKKNKRKNWLKIILLSTVVTLAATAGIYLGLVRMSESNAVKIQKHYLLRSEIAYPNIDYISWGYQTTSHFSGNFYSNRVKDIDGITVPFEKYTGNYGIVLRHHINQDEMLKSGDQGNSQYTYGNYYKVPVFYNLGEQGVENKTPTHDLDFVPQMTGQAVEVAITFKKPHTLAEIEEMLPDNLKLNWVWIGQESGIDFGNGLANQFGFTNYPNASLSAEEQASLEKEVDAAMEKDENADLTPIYEKYEKESQESELTILYNNYSVFQSNLQKYLDTGYGFSTTIDADGKERSAEDYLKDYLEANENPETAKFAGVILTGRAENFAQLQNANWIYASSIGQSIQIQPYHQLDK